VQTTVDQMKEKVRQQDLAQNLNLTSEAVALCPSCGARPREANSVPSAAIRYGLKTSVEVATRPYKEGANFCPECGNKVA